MAPHIEKVGTIDCDLVESTPIVFHDRLYRFEYVREQRHYAPNTTGAPYFRFVDMATGACTPGFAAGYHLGSAFAAEGMAYAYGVERWGGSTVQAFWSSDLEQWDSAPALTMPGWGLYNSSVCQGPDRYIMAFEVGEPEEVAGVRFTNYFAESTDLRHWTPLSLEHVFTKERYSACPAIRYQDGWYYVFYLEVARFDPILFETFVVRSRDLVTWESSPFNPVLTPTPEDHLVANRALTAEQQARIAHAEDINNSDMDLCEYQGQVVITYSWGTQRGCEHLAEARYAGTLAEFLRGWFPG